MQHSLLPFLCLLAAASLAGCSPQAPAPLPQPSHLDTAAFRTTLDGHAVGLYTLRAPSGLEASVTNYGARVVTLLVPAADGTRADVVCGFDSIGGYLARRQNFGAVVGRYIGRILGGEVTIDGTTHLLDRDSRGHCSHGGRPGFACRVWDVVQHTADSLVLRYTSPDGESGFPGALTLHVTYRLTDDALRIDYRATTDRPTVLNPSNHSFFNLSGRLDTDVLDQTLWVDADSICEYDAHKCVTGRMLPVRDTPFDFTTPHTIGERIDADDAQLRVTGGYDHCFRLNTPGSLARPAARIVAHRGAMEVYTTEPGLHIYAAGGHRGDIVGKDSTRYVHRNSICFETMHFPDSPHQPQWPTTLLRPGQTFCSTTVFRFGTYPPQEEPHRQGQ